MTLTLEGSMMRMKTRTRTEPGFSLIELLISMAVGLIVILAVSSLFKTGVDATFLVTQRAEIQQNLRAGMEMMVKDISQAGAGLPTGGLQLPTGGVLSNFACNQAPYCYLTNFNYPTVPTKNYMYGIIPGWSNGVEKSVVIANAPAARNDSITSIYCDYNFPLWQYNITFASATKITLAPNPVFVPAPPLINGIGGINTGDLILLVVSAPPAPGNGTNLVQTGAAVGEVTNVPSTTEIDFNAGDPLNMNQSGGGIANNIATAAAAAAAAGANANITACRLFAVTYFIEVPAAGGAVQTPRLMRQVNGLTAVPVADNILNLQITYDVIQAGGAVDANQPNPLGAAPVESPALIQKVNIVLMGESLTQMGNKSQNMYLATSVSARNQSFRNFYVGK
jgi:prepilin-type N-terminal cleavage/methylation domain-containing protein